ncbi:calcium-dependent lipid-binding family protein [Trifolium repens]|nr:calcium-dependent lipid-binding family protein [Trifolium repens]
MLGNGLLSSITSSTCRLLLLELKYLLSNELMGFLKAVLADLTLESRAESLSAFSKGSTSTKRYAKGREESLTIQ